MIYLHDSDVCTKYQEAAKIVNLTLEGLIAQCKVGALVLDLCKFGTTVMETAAMKLYTKKNNGQEVQRGVAFPVCISVNDVVCNHSPLASEELVSDCKHTTRLLKCQKCLHDIFMSCWSQYQVIAECVYTIVRSLL